MIMGWTLLRLGTENQQPIDTVLPLHPLPPDRRMADRLHLEPLPPFLARQLRI